MEVDIKIPPAVKEVLDTFQKAGFEAHIVGGPVRDALLGKTPKDWDINTNATPEQIQKLFKRTFYTNDFGTVTVMIPETIISFRAEPDVPARPGLVETIRKRRVTFQELMTTSWFRGPWKAPEADPEGDRAVAYWERKITAPGYKLPYAGLTFAQKSAILAKFPKKKKSWKGGGHAP